MDQMKNNIVQFNKAKQADLLNCIKSRISYDQKFKIVFYGDSTTSTEWVHPNWREIIEYVVKMELEEFKDAENGMSKWNYSWWNLNFINSGLNGAETKHYLSRLERDVFSHAPDMIIFILGGNDVDKVSEKIHAKNVNFLLNLMTNKIPHVYFATDIYTANAHQNKRYKEYIGELLKHFPKKGVDLIDLFDHMSKLDISDIYTYKLTKEEESFLADQDFKEGTVDTFHPNRLGNAYIAQCLLKSIFNIDFNPEIYVQDVIDDVKYPRY